MDRYCKFFIVLVTLATVIASGHCAGNAAAGLAVNVTVSVKSQMGPNTDLHVHCVSDPPSSTALPGVDYGEHSLVDDEVYNLSFLRQSTPHSDKIIIRCHFLSIGLPPKDVAIYYGLYYPYTNCPCLMESGVERSNWTISPAGFFCRSIRRTQFGQRSMKSTISTSFQSSPHLDKITIRYHSLRIDFTPTDVVVYYGLYYPHTNCRCLMESGVETSNWTISPTGFFCRSSKVVPWF